MAGTRQAPGGRLLVGVIAALGLVVAVSSSSGFARTRLTLEPCNVQAIPAQCGTFAVPENRAHPDGRKIDLGVVVVPAAQKHALPDAFTYLIGGPGGASTQMTSWVVETFPWVHSRHDILLVDQRGTGASHPLSCSLPTHPLTTAAKARAYAKQCLRSLNADVTQFGTRAAMDDLDAVRAALGYRQLDIYGASYGATAAQVFLKRHPASVRTITLDGSTEIDVPFYSRFAVDAQAALNQVAERCAASTRCRNAFPTWRSDFSKLVEAWDEHPVTNRKGERTTGAGLAGVVQTMLLDAGTAAQIPLLVSRAAKGDYASLNARLVQSPTPQLDLMYYGIWCNEPWVGLDAHGPWHTDFDSTTTSSIATHRKICRYVPKRAEPSADWALPRSRTPLLLLAGGADPQDPIGNMPRLDQAFPNSRAVIVPNYGHTVAQFGCMARLVSDFVRTGKAKELDTRCVGDIAPPRFSLE